MSYITDFTLRNTPQLDAFGRLRVSTPETLFDLTHLYDKQPIFIQELTANGATSTHLTNEASVAMDVTTTVGSRIVRQTYRYISYQPGKSKQIVLTGILCTALNAGVTARIGAFDDDADKSVDSGGNGVFFQYSGGVLSAVVRSYTSGSQVDTVIPQASWADPLDGTGPSGITLDLTKEQIFGIDFQWLGAGRVRFVFGIGGAQVVAYESLHANLLTSVYMSTGTLPIRYELEQVTGSAAAQMKMTCIAVNSEGGYNPRGRIWSVSNGITSRAISATETPILGVRLRSGYNRGTVNPLRLNPYCTTNDDNIWRIYLAPNGALTGGSWANVNANAATEVNKTGTGVTLTNAYLISELYINQAVSQVTAFENTLLAAADIAGASQEIIITGQNFSGNADVYCAFQFQEWL